MTRGRPPLPAILPRPHAPRRGRRGGMGAAFALSLLLLACPTEDDGDDDDAVGDDDATGDDDTTEPGPWDGGEEIVVTVDGQAMIEGSFDGQGPIWWALDTGAARTYVDEDLTGTGNNVIGDVVIGPLEFEDKQVGSVELDDAEAFIGWDLGGLAGQDVFEGRFVALDYAGLQAHFLDELPDEGPPCCDTAAPATSAYDLPSSIPVMSAELSGAGGAVQIDLIADTGSGVTILLESVFDAIDDGTLPRVEGYVWGTNYGFDDGFLTRVPVIAAGEGDRVEVAHSWAVVIPDDNHLWALLEGNGIFADGFLGYPFYRRFVVGVDGHEDRYLWWPYPGDDHIDPREWTRVGIEPTWRDGGFTVEMLYRPSDAQTQGVQIGDRITAVDGTDLAGSTLDDLKHLLRGDPGDTRTLDLERGDQGLQVVVTVDDLLPRP